MTANLFRSLIFTLVIFQVFRLIAGISGLPTDTTYDPVTYRSYTSKETMALDRSLWLTSFGCGFLFFRALERQRKTTSPADAARTVDNGGSQP